MARKKREAQPKVAGLSEASRRRLARAYSRDLLTFDALEERFGLTDYSLRRELASMGIPEREESLVRKCNI